MPAIQHNMSNRISAIIVNYCTQKLTEACIASIRRFDITKPEDIIVVDNSSPDGSGLKLVKSLPQIHVVLADTNRGFSSGINIGAAHATNEFLLILNPDTYFIDNSISEALSVFDKHPDVGVVGLNLTNPDGSPQHSARTFYSWTDIVGRRLFIGRYWPVNHRIRQHLMIDAWKDSSPFPADWVMGTGFLIRRSLFDTLGGMDESYFLYMEDVDLCARVWGKGFRVMCAPMARLVHDHQRSSAAAPFSWAGRMHLRSLATFSKKFPIPLFSRPSIKAIRSAFAKSHT